MICRYGIFLSRNRSSINVRFMRGEAIFTPDIIEEFFLEFVPEHYLRSLSHKRSPELVQKRLWIVPTTYGLAL